MDEKDNFCFSTSSLAAFKLISIKPLLTMMPGHNSVVDCNCEEGLQGNYVVNAYSYSRLASCIPISFLNSGGTDTIGDETVMRFIHDRTAKTY